MFDGGGEEGFCKREGDVVGGCSDFPDEIENCQAKGSLSRGERTLEKDDIQRGNGPSIFGIGKRGREFLQNVPNPGAFNDVEVSLWGGRRATRARKGGEGERVNFVVLIFEEPTFVKE